MVDPLTALMYAVQVMNFLKTLIEKALHEREESLIEPAPLPESEPSDDNENQSSSRLHQENPVESNDEMTQDFLSEDPGSDTGSVTSQLDNITDEDYYPSYSSCTEESDESGSCETPCQVYKVTSTREAGVMESLQNKFGENMRRGNTGESSDSDHIKSELKIDDKNKGNSNLSRINSITERFETWW